MRTKSESGFALLLVFALSAAIAVMLYKELPRAAFEAQRAREETLIQRGEEYKRGIQLYVAKMKKYPASLDDLERSARIRFLRRRYRDPMTGEDEWRLIHIDGAGRFTDSLVHKQKGLNDGKSEYQNTFISEGPAIGATVTQGSGAATLKDRRRPSDSLAPGIGQGTGAPVDPNAPPAPPDPNAMPVQADPNAQPVHLDPNAQAMQQDPNAQLVQPDPNAQPMQPDPNAQPVQPDPNAPQIDPATGQLIVAAQPGQDGGDPAQGGDPSPLAERAVQEQVVQFPAAQVAAPQQPPEQPPQFTGPQPAQGSANYPPVSLPNRPVTNAPGGGNAPGRVNAPGGMNAPAPTPGMPGQTPTEAAKMIQGILTSPRPGGAVAGTQMGSAPGQQIGGGIAGVASKLEADSIKIYEERQKYNEWEFLYDFSKDKKRGTGAMNQGQGNQNTNRDNQNRGGSGSISGTGFGGGSSTTGFGSGQRP
jgi:hypothetical protein